MTDDDDEQIIHLCSEHNTHEEYSLTTEYLITLAFTVSIAAKMALFVYGKDYIVPLSIAVGCGVVCAAVLLGLLMPSVQVLRLKEHQWRTGETPWSLAAKMMGLAADEPDPRYPSQQHWSGRLDEYYVDIFVPPPPSLNTNGATQQELLIEPLDGACPGDVWLPYIATPQCFTTTHRKILKKLSSQSRTLDRESLNAHMVDVDAPDLYTLLWMLDPKMTHGTDAIIPLAWKYETWGGCTKFARAKYPVNGNIIEKELKQIQQYMSSIKRNRHEIIAMSQRLCDVKQLRRAFDIHESDWDHGNWCQKTLIYNGGSEIDTGYAPLQLILTQQYEATETQRCIEYYSGGKLTSYKITYEGQEAYIEDAFERFMREELLRTISSWLHSSEATSIQRALEICDGAKDKRFALLAATIVEERHADIPRLLEEQAHTETVFVDSNTLETLSGMSLTQQTTNQLLQSLLALLQTQCTSYGKYATPFLTYHHCHIITGLIRQYTPHNDRERLDISISHILEHSLQWLSEAKSAQDSPQKQYHINHHGDLLDLVLLYLLHWFQPHHIALLEQILLYDNRLLPPQLKKRTRMLLKQREETLQGSLSLARIDTETGRVSMTNEEEPLFDKDNKDSPRHHQ